VVLVNLSLPGRTDSSDPPAWIMYWGCVRLHAHPPPLMILAARVPASVVLLSSRSARTKAATVRHLVSA
jgi:hypothetical protein